MLFNSPLFLFLFLPLTIFLYYLSPKRARNGILFFISVIFYAWGEVFYVLLLISSIVINYFVAYSLAYYRKPEKKKSRIKADKLIISAGIIINIGLLCSFKYAGFFTENLNNLLYLLNIKKIILEPVHLPLGISFFTFQAISYIVDVYRGVTVYEKNILNVGLYISLFPQLIAGPILRYNTLSGQIIKREESLSKFSYGSRRFVIGLAKKVLIADALAALSDPIFALPVTQLSIGFSWLGVVSYAFQIFFDFSGYSDMAIGLGMIFGFRFLENFNYPYIATSVSEFWRRWHISLSTWFRDYLYIPLGGNRKSAVITYRNLVVVFLLCGLWHGPSWNFVVWGLLHGLFLIFERAGGLRIINKLWRPIRHFYTLGFFFISLVIFRQENLFRGFDYIKVLFHAKTVTPKFYYLESLVTVQIIYTLVFAVILSTPVIPWLRRRIIAGDMTGKKAMTIAYLLTQDTLLFILFFLSVITVVSTTFKPFIYFRF